MKPETQSHTEASVITTVVMLLGFLCLWFIYIDVPVLQEDEGIEISFGDGETGGGVPDISKWLLPRSKRPLPPRHLRHRIICL